MMTIWNELQHASGRKHDGDDDSVMKKDNKIINYYMVCTLQNVDP